MARRQRATKRFTPESFDLGRFMRAAGYRSYPYEQEHQTPEVTWPWWDDEQVFFGRRGEELLYMDWCTWDTLARAMVTWPHIAIQSIWRMHPCQPGMLAAEPCIFFESAVPWPTSFDEAFAAMVRWGILYEHHRAEMHQEYAAEPLKALMRQALSRAIASRLTSSSGGR
jgi:hypothetical protein